MIILDILGTVLPILVLLFIVTISGRADIVGLFVFLLTLAFVAIYYFFRIVSLFAKTSPSGKWSTRDVILLFIAIIFFFFSFFLAFSYPIQLILLIVILPWFFWFLKYSKIRILLILLFFIFAGIFFWLMSRLGIPVEQWISFKRII